jgi:hypothetical protein
MRLIDIMEQARVPGYRAIRVILDGEVITDTRLEITDNLTHQVEVGDYRFRFRLTPAGLVYGINSPEPANGVA